MRLTRLFRPDPYAAPAQRLYLAVVDQARQPAFYAQGGVPDTVDGRFEMIALHLFLVLHRLKRDDAPGAHALARALSESLFDDMDRGLREMGAGDLGVGKRVQAMAEGFYGRVAAYEAGLAGDALDAALARNVYGTIVAPAARQVADLSSYVRQAAAALGALTFSALTDGRLQWPALTAPPADPI
jgi:cytochrome b pre-mRNA-processing protein 3